MSIEIKNLYKNFGNTVIPVLEDINLEIKESEFICILGPSGCGKSTLLNIIAGLDKPTSGTVAIDGHEITSPGSDRVMMFQEPALFPWLSVIDNVKFGMKYSADKKNRLTEDEQNARAGKYLEMVHLSDFRNYNIHQLSGGMKQRCSLARALTFDSKALLMDEPFAALDKQTKNVLRDELSSIWQQTGRTMIYVTHSVEEAMFFGDRVVMLSSSPGKIKKIFTMDFERPRHIDDEKFVHIRADILKQLRNEVDINAKV